MEKIGRMVPKNAVQLCTPLRYVALCGGASLSIIMAHWRWVEIVRSKEAAIFHPTHVP